jgi:hypothetical protein
MSKPNIAEQALIQAYDILCTLSNVDHNKQWVEHSIPKHELDKLARKLRYKSIEHLVDTWDEPRVDDPYDGNGPFP